jgi:hypothetical protein
MGRYDPQTDWRDLRKFVGDGKNAPAVYVRAGEGSIDIDDEDDVYIAVVFDVQGFSGHTAAIYADQNRYHASADTALQEAFEELENYVIDANPDHVAELQEEWGHEWSDILTETFDARIWVLSARDAAKALRGSPAAEFVDIYDADGNELSGAKGDWAHTANQQIFIPDRQIKTDKAEYVYVPVRGYAGSLAVFDINDKVIGWIDTRTLGHENVREWMRATNWRDTGY